MPKQTSSPREFSPSSVTTTTEVYVFSRVSSDRQAEPEHVSLDAQEAACRAAAKSKGWRVVPTRFPSRFVFPAWPEVPSQVKRLVHAALVARKRRSLVVHSVSRFARNEAEGLRLARMLHKRGGFVFACLENLRSDLEPERFAECLRAAEAESKNLSERVRASLAIKKELGGHHGPSPYGWKNERSEHDGVVRLVPSQAEQAVCRLASTLVRGGVSLAEANAQLAEAIRLSGVDQSGKGREEEEEEEEGGVFAWVRDAMAFFFDGGPFPLLSPSSPSPPPAAAPIAVWDDRTGEPATTIRERSLSLQNVADLLNDYRLFRRKGSPWTSSAVSAAFRHLA